MANEVFPTETDECMALEHVYAVWDYWDRIRSGFADFRGMPHYFESPWDESSDDCSDVFVLTPVSSATIELVVEQAEIFRSWAIAFHRGEVTEGSHPALPGQNDRYAQLNQAIRTVVGVAKPLAHPMRGRFETIARHHLPPGIIRDVCVEWSEP
jgi:hypothetical protein